MTHRQRNLFSQLVTISLALCLLAGHAFAQGATAFTYQGRLQDAGQPANGVYDLQFALYDADASGNQIGANVTLEDVAVVNGVFTAQLDFGAAAFDGGARFLAIAVRPGASTGSFTPLTPRSPFTPTPYAIRSASAAVADNATQLNGVAAGQYVQTNDTRLSDARTPTAGSANYIQNGTTAQTGNFNISGNGTAGGTFSGNAVNTETQFNIRSFRALSSNGGGNFVGGINAGFNLSTGTDNTFFGNNAGQTTFSGGSNALFGTEAGRLLTSSFNTLIGGRAGRNITTGAGNVFLGNDTGLSLTTGNSNTLVGSGANITGNPNFATALGAGAVANQNNSVVLGRALDTVRVPGNLDVTGTITGNFNIDGANITNLNAANIATGTLNNARLGIIPLANGGTGLSVSGATGNFLRSDGVNWTSSPIQLADLPNLGNSFIQNGTAPQTGDFNISGNGTIGGSLTANTVNAVGVTGSLFVNAPQYNLNNVRAFSNAGFNNLFAGVNVAPNNTGQNNAFFGANSGAANTSGNRNSFFGSNAGAANVSGEQNSFFGNQAGASNIATGNSFFGNQSGLGNTTGNQNSFFGMQAGISNTDGGDNSFFGYNAGFSSTGSSNAFFGTNAGRSNQTGSFNTFIGRQAGMNVTIGSGNVFIGNDTGLNNTTGNSNTAIGSGANMSNGLSFATAIGAGALTTTSNTVTLGRSTDQVNVAGTLRVQFFGTAGGTAACINASNQLSLCSSSRRYKTDISPYLNGLDFIKRLQPVSFTWKDGGMRDLGFVAEDVAAIDPLLAVRDQNGQVEGVKYDRLSTLLVNAVQEQQTQIEAQKQEIENLKTANAENAELKNRLAQQQKQIEELKQIVCAANPNAGLCKAQK